jgi:hypothetical protein
VGLEDDKLIDILLLCKCEYWHKDGYGVDIKYFFDREGKHHHTEYFCTGVDGSMWMEDPETIIGNVIHIDSIGDEVFSRGIHNEH